MLHADTGSLFDNFFGAGRSNPYSNPYQPRYQTRKPAQQPRPQPARAPVFPYTEPHEFVENQVPPKRTRSSFAAPTFTGSTASLQQEAARRQREQVEQNQNELARAWQARQAAEAGKREAEPKKAEAATAAKKVEATAAAKAAASVEESVADELFDELNDHHCAMTGMELDKPSLEGWTRADVEAYFQSEGVYAPEAPEERAAVKIQSWYHGCAVRKSGIVGELRERREALDEVLAAAEGEAAKFEPWVFDQNAEAVQDAKQLNGVPVPLIEYEEMLLRLQLKLDGMESAGLGAPIMRQWRKNANKQLQARLDAVDACRATWKAAAVA